MFFGSSCRILKERRYIYKIPAEFFFSKNIRQMTAGLNNKYDIAKTLGLVQVCSFDQYHSALLNMTLEVTSKIGFFVKIADFHQRFDKFFDAHTAVLVNKYE